MNLRHSAIAARMPPADGAIRPYTVPSRSSLALIVRVDDVIQTVSAALGGVEDRRRTRWRCARGARPTRSPCGSAPRFLLSLLILTLIADCFIAERAQPVPATSQSRNRIIDHAQFRHSKAPINFTFLPQLVCIIHYLLKIDMSY